MKNLWLIVWTARHTTRFSKKGAIEVYGVYATRRAAEKTMREQFTSLGAPPAQVISVPQCLILHPVTAA